MLLNNVHLFMWRLLASPVKYVFITELNDVRDGMLVCFVVVSRRMPPTCKGSFPKPYEPLKVLHWMAKIDFAHVLKIRDCKMRLSWMI